MAFVPLARSLLARQSHSNFPRSGTELDFDCTRSIDREDVSKPTLPKSTKRRKVKNNGEKMEERNKNGGFDVYKHVDD